jgi:hypothetical protein
VAAVVFQLNVLEPLLPSMQHKLTHIHSDNTPSVAWLTRMATTSKTQNMTSVPKYDLFLTRMYDLFHCTNLNK